jgi:5-methyltetrahydropteroyltriglutamate--homocysteine methyltransferase
VPLLADEVARLATAGAYSIVIEEPCLLREPESFPRLNDALEVIAARRGASRLWVFPSFGDAGALYDRLQALPVDGLVLDLTRGSGAAEAVAAAGSRLAILLGIVDVRTTRLEMPGRLAKTAAALLRNVRAPLAGLVPSGGLEALPRDRAFEKCRVLARTRDLLSGKGSRKRSSGRPNAKRPARRGAGR